jgi:hypothetical protein
MFYIFPKYNKKSQSSFHLEQLVKRFVDKAFLEHQIIDANELISKKISLQDKENVLFINWLDTLYFELLNRKIAIIFSLVLPNSILIKIADYYHKKLIKLFEFYYKEDVKVIFYFHDKESFSRIAIYQLIDKKLRKYLYYSCHQVLFCERSAQEEIEKEYGYRRSFHISCLGSYKDCFGDLLKKNEIKNKFGIPHDSLVVVSIGTIRKNRNNKAIIDFILHSKNVFYLGGGLGHQHLRKKRIYSISGYLSNERVLEFLSCADYVLHSGREYLTSSIVRVAVTYNIPVIAERFGSTIDMCGGTLQELPRHIQGFEKFFAELPRNNSPEYIKMVEELKIKNSERTWEKAANGLLNAYKNIF